MMSQSAESAKIIHKTTTEMSIAHIAIHSVNHNCHTGAHTGAHIGAELFSKSCTRYNYNDFRV